jgi:hypothetical protein
MKPSLLRLSRLFAWTAALGSLVALFLGYELLPAQIPLTRWSTGPKTWFLVLRVPAINLFCLILVQVLERALVRVHRDTAFRENAMRVVAILYATLGIKAFLEALESLLLPAVLPWLFPVLLFVILAGVAGVVRAGWPLARKNAHPKITFTPAETALAASCVLGIAGLQLPLL